MEIKKSSIEEQKKNFERDFNNPHLYVCQIIDKKVQKPVGVLPFMSFSSLDAMVIINALASQAKISSSNLKFVSLEGSNLLVSAKGENDKYALNASIEELDKILEKEKKGETNDEESGSVQEDKE